MILTLAKGILIEVVKRSDLVRHFQIFHIKDFSSGKHICRFNGALAHLLINNGLVHLLLDGVRHSCGTLVVIALESILVSPNSSFVGSWIVNVVVTNDLGPGLLEHAQELHLLLLLILIEGLLIVRFI